MRPLAIFVVIPCLFVAACGGGPETGAVSGVLSDAADPPLTDTAPGLDVGETDVSSPDAVADEADAPGPEADVAVAPCDDALFLAVTSEFWPAAVTTLADGDAVVVGRFVAQLELGGFELVGEEDRWTAFAARIDAETCGFEWVEPLGVDRFPTDVAAGSDPAGPLVVAAGGPVGGASAEAYVIYVDPQTGGSDAEVVLLASPSDGVGSIQLNGIAVTDGGDLITGGGWSGLLSVGALEQRDAGSPWLSGFVARFDPQGQLSWLLSVDVAAVSDVATTPGGGVAVAGRFNGELDLGVGAPVTPAATNFSSVYVAGATAGGQWAWATSVGVQPVGDDVCLVADGDGAVFVGTNYTNPVPPGPEPVDDPPRQQPGTHLGTAFHRSVVARVGPAGSTWLTSVDAVDVHQRGGRSPRLAVAAGRLHVAGALVEATDFGLEQVLEGGPNDAMIGWLATFELDQPIPTRVEEVVEVGDKLLIEGLAADEQGRAWIVGRFDGALEGPDGEATSPGPRGGFIARRPAAPGD